MSLSPRNENDPEQIFQYRKGWAAINTMLEQGRSLSGRERHCAFLNTGGRRFADISAASGLDLIDDGRGVALVDWDCDGRIDLWTTNRTGPWVRLLQNQSRTEHHFVAISLQGVECNRDAIGARLELHIAGDSPRILHRTLRAGEGFVAQSSKRIVFGLGQAREIEKLVVHWPGDSPQTVAGLRADRHYRVVQGRTTPVMWNPPPTMKLPSPPPTAAADSTARIALAAPVPLPELRFERFDGSRSNLPQDADRPTLINLWASWCAPCLRELEDFKSHWPELSQHVDIMALNVDALGTESEAPAADVEGPTRQRQFPFTSGRATKDVVSQLEIVVNALVDKPQPLIVPMSVLVDGQGRVAMIYRGPVSTKQLLGDVAAIDDALAQRRDRAAHFAGRWFDEPRDADPSTLLRRFVVADRLSDAESYLQLWKRKAGREQQPSVDSYYVVADAHRAAGQLDAAAALYRQALAIDPDQPRVNLDLAICLMRLQRPEEACTHLETSLVADPQNADSRRRLVMILARLQRYAQMQHHASILVRTNEEDVLARLHLAYAMKKQQRYASALEEYHASVGQRPDLAIAQNDLAWLLATCPDDQIRDGEAAVRHAELACGATNHAHPALLDTLAAAWAETGEFDKAIAILENALSLTTKSGDERLAAIITGHINLYRRREPLRDG